MHVPLRVIDTRLPYGRTHVLICIIFRFGIVQRGYYVLGTEDLRHHDLVQS